MLKLYRSSKRLTIPKKDLKNLELCQMISDDFNLFKDKTNFFIISENLDIVIKVKKNGFIPKSGIYLAQALNKINIEKNVLDIGTGETGFLAHYLLARGARQVVACDIDEETIKYASTASNNNNIIWSISDVYLKIPNLKYNLIVSNPPQMPMPTFGHRHDYGGSSGRNIILRIIKESSSYLANDGKIILLCFDFLGITQRFNSEQSINEIAQDYGFQCKIINKYKRNIRKGGKTEASMDWIKHIYPLYEFKKDSSDAFFHEIFILKLSKT